MKVRVILGSLVIGKHNVRRIGFVKEYVVDYGLFPSDMEDLNDSEKDVIVKRSGCLISVLKDELMHEPIYQREKKH